VGLDDLVGPQAAGQMASQTQSLGRAEQQCALRQQGRLEPDAAPGEGMNRSTRAP
jgi:hypothetical protein